MDDHFEDGQSAEIIVLHPNQGEQPKRSSPAPALRARVMTEDVVALYFATLHKDELRFSTGQGWFRWDGRCWRQGKAEVIELVRKTCRDLGRDADDDTRKRLGKAAFIKSIAALAERGLSR